MFRLPTEHDIGYLVNISVGHTQRPIDVEMAMLALHLKEAGFLEQKGSESPMKSIPNSVDNTKSVRSKEEFEQT